MTAKGLFEALLTELSKENSPSLLLDEFNYYINRAINQYINKRYNVYDTTQQTTDDLRVLKASAALDVEKAASDYGDLSDLGAGLSKLFGATYDTHLPLDYMHMLNCICIYEVKKRYSCYDAGNFVQFPAKRLTADSWSTIVTDYYTRPLPQRPYYYIHNINQQAEVPTNPITDTILSRTSEGTDVANIIKNSTGNTTALNPVPKTISLDSIANNSLEPSKREAGVRYGNSSGVRCEIRYGQDDSVFELKKVLIDYIKAPQHVRLTQEQVNLTEDTSQELEFPDYVCLEIINELVTIVQERVADPRLASHVLVSLTIANPTQQLPTQSVSGYERRYPTPRTAE